MTAPSLANLFGTNDPSVIAPLEREARVEHVSKGECILRSGDVQTKVRFLLSGIMRGFLIDQYGHDVTDCFMWQPGAPVVPSARLDVPSPVSIEALTDATLLSLPVETVEHVVTTTLPGALAYNRMLQQAWETHWTTKSVLARCKSHERYAWFKRAYPGVEDHVAARHVASFLGMTPVTLSRVRSQHARGRG